MIKVRLILLLLFFPLLNSALSQPEQERLGTTERGNFNYAYYNFGEDDKVNIEVSLMGYVKNSGRYLIPEGTKFLELISFSGGPMVDAELNKIRILRQKNEELGITFDQVIYLDYDNLFWEEKVSMNLESDPVLLPGDIVIFPGEPRLFLRDQLSIILSISSTLISLAILLLNVFKN